MQSNDGWSLGIGRLRPDWDVRNSKVEGSLTVSHVKLRGSEDSDEDTDKIYEIQDGKRRTSSVPFSSRVPALFAFGHDLAIGHVRSRYTLGWPDPVQGPNTFPVSPLSRRSASSSIRCRTSSNSLVRRNFANIKSILVTEANKSGEWDFIARKWPKNEP